ncbi:hypothetical protein SAMN02800687_0536 [Curtobacterium sp. UNCCL20]|uniref:hypothetical protein n=1 Tax=Curtobacterium sp. UNCCL20 TaxID=1502773 RepID=UPI00088D3D43|nr:hypothetical protein [Curtobacterium sp. UNCCL20]SDQ14286.1 hypothetical protein SAMN02800687_0536 [Curtobacterium sp. UNCCL20]
MNDLDLAFGRLVGVIAHGRDYGRVDEPQRGPRGRQATPEEEEFLIRSGSCTREEYAESNAEVARGELDEIERRTELEGLVASLTGEEAAEWLSISDAELHALLAAGEVTAFVCHGQLRYPAWQFTDDPAMPVLPGLARLTPAWGEQKHPSTILGFMYNADLEIEGTDESFTPVERLSIGGDVQVVLDHLEAASWP